MEVFRFFRLLLVVIGLELAAASSRSSETIKFESGQYRDILIGIDGDKIPEAECKNIIQYLNAILPEFSRSLQEATEGKASIGDVNVIIPQNWTAELCGGPIGEAPPHFCYDSSHIQLTHNHPLAVNLPWTRQYKPCGHEGDSITIPFTFLNASFTNKIKGKLLLHEWTKFRYGAFDEIGYEQDMLEPCYVFKKEAQFSSCAGTPLPSVGSVKSVCNANFLLQQEFILMKFLSSANSSIMSFPYLDNVAHFCTESSHNRRAPTKQNLYCKRSVSEVVNSHSDFRNAQPTIRQDQPQLRILQRPKRLGKIQTAYAFVIDVSEEMRKEWKLQHVKQAISEFIQMLNAGTPVQLISFAEGEVIVNLEGSLENDGDKITFLQAIPDDSINQQPPPQIQRVLIPVVDTVIASLASRSDFAWNILLFSDPAVGQTDMPQAIEKFRATPHHISVFTFELQSQEASDMWLSWYKLPNTKNVIVLPYCKIPQYPSPCSVQTSIFITDHLVGLLNEQYDDPRFVQKVAEVVINNGGGQGQTQFNIEGIKENIKSIYFFFPLPQNDPSSASKVKLISPLGSECGAEALLEYELVLTFPCDFQSGTWTLRLDGQVEPGIARLHLDVFVEYEEEATERLLVTSSLGQTDLTSELQPNSPLTTIFIHLTTSQGNPVLDADVSIKIFYPSLLSTNGNGYDSAKMITLRDNGDDNNADQTRNDGIYSAFLVGYDKQWPSNHLGQVNIKTNGNTKILEEIETPNATFLRSQLASKCCGKVIRSRTTRALKAPVQFQTLHLGFKTDGPWTNISGPPGFIGAITVESDDDNQVEIQFASVPGDVSDPAIKVGEVQACCIPTNENGDNPQLAPTELDCKQESVQCGEFVDPPGLQSCTISKQTLADLFITEEIFNSVVCGLRATSTGGVNGQISSDTFSTSLPAEVRQNGSGEPECDSIGDGCLPIWIFWVMIGCIGLLLIIIVIILIIWACLSRSKKEKVTPQREGTRRRSSFDYPPPRKDRRDSPVEYATVMVETPPPKKEEPKVVKELFVNHAYIQNEDGELKIIADNGKILRKPLTNDQQPPIRRSEMREIPDNMPVFKPQPVPVPIPTTRSIGSRKRPQIVHQNPMLRSDSELQLNTAQIIPITNGYASVSRAGRNRVEPTPPSPKLVTFDPHYMTPKQDRLPKDPVPTPPPPKVHPYPSSDSSDSSEDPRKPQPPKFNKPPRYPIGSKFIKPQFRPQSMSSAGSPPNHAPIPPPRSQPPQAPPVRQPVMQFRHAEDEDSDEWDDGENYGVSYA